MFRKLKKNQSGAKRTQAFSLRAGFGQSGLTSIEKPTCFVNPIGRSLLLLMLLVSGAVKSTAQSPEIPNIEYPTLPCELRNEHRVFVQAPLSTRDEIVKELRRHEEIIIAERPEDADYFLLFAYTFGEDGLVETAGAVGYAEMTAVKFVRLSKDQVRPRILFHWQGKKISRSVPIPFHGLSPTGFSRPRSTGSAVTELIGRLAGWALTKRWPKTFYFDQLTNQLTISTGGKFETNGTRAFLKELKKARGESYVQRCTPPPAVTSSSLAAERPRVRRPRGR
jgi:hypothetical protein